MMLGTLALSPAAAAHTELTFSQPYDGAALDRAPREVRLQFNEPVSDDFARVTITVGDAEPTRAHVRARERLVVVKVPASLNSAAGKSSQAGSGPARWRVAYRVASQDGHPVTGTVTFSVEPSPPLSESATPSPGETQGSGAEEPPAGAGDTEAPVPTSSGGSAGGSDAWASTLSVGLVAAVLTGAGVVWVARGRRRDQGR